MDSTPESRSEAAAAAVPLSGTLSHELSNYPERELAPGLHPQMLALFIGSYGAMLLSLWVFFAADINAMIALGICTVYFSMYFGVPIFMNRMADKAAPRPAPGSFSRFLKADIDTYTGRVSAWGAIAQLMTIPIGLTCTFIAIGLIIRLGA